MGTFCVSEEHAETRWYTLCQARSSRNFVHAQKFSTYAGVWLVSSAKVVVELYCWQTFTYVTCDVRRDKNLAYPKLISNLWVTCFEPMSNIFDVFRTTKELTERVSNLQLPYNGVLEAFMRIGILNMGWKEDYDDVKVQLLFQSSRGTFFVGYCMWSSAIRRRALSSSWTIVGHKLWTLATR